VKIDIVCSSVEHPVNPWLEEWREQRQDEHEIKIVREVACLQGGDVLFLVSCTELLQKQIRNKYAQALVLHASDLPQGRGWSPYIWQILDGARTITVSLLDADHPVDSGAIWAKISFPVAEHLLHDEINEALFRAELQLMDRGLDMAAAGHRPVPQPEGQSSYWPRRRPSDSEVDPYKPLVAEFDKIRVADPVRYPAFFRLHGYKYSIEIRKLGKDEADND